MSTLVRSETEQVPESPVVSISRPRLDSIDIIRGLVMVIMALDHTKGFFSNSTFNAVDPGVTTAPYFFTRFISHYCAPTFVFLAGTGAFLYGSRGRTKGQVSWFLFSRGLWIVILEETWIHFAWNPHVSSTFFFGGVLWAIGLSMIGMSLLVYLPLWQIVGVGLVLIFVHNYFDGVKGERFGRLGGIWSVLHSQEFVNLSSEPLAVAKPWKDNEPPPELVFMPQYPLIPWIGVMACGYGLGTLYLLPPEKRRKWLVQLGLWCIGLFFLLRWINGRCDPYPWRHFEEVQRTIFSFLNCHKYPPSLLFVLMTLGPMLIALAFAERSFGILGRILVTFGRVPMFYYLIHIPLLLGLSVLLAYLKYDRLVWPDTRPQGYGYDLHIVYGIWLGVVTTLYLPCLWFSRLKQRSKAAWLSYF